MIQSFIKMNKECEPYRTIFPEGKLDIHSENESEKLYFEYHKINAEEGNKGLNYQQRIQLVVSEICEEYDNIYFYGFKSPNANRKRDKSFLYYSGWVFITNPKTIHTHIYRFCHVDFGGDVKLAVKQTQEVFSGFEKVLVNFTRLLNKQNLD
eukprot:UN27780